MSFLIDARGRRQQRYAIDLSCAIWRKGCVHIREEKQGIIVSLSPLLVKGPTLAAAVYAIAEINPQYISLILENSNCIAVVFHADWRTACKRICELVAASRHPEEMHAVALRGGAETLTESEALDDPEQIIAATLKRHLQGNPESLTRQILEELWEAGYDVRPRYC
jgi:hypothetical protein